VTVILASAETNKERWELPETLFPLGHASLGVRYRRVRNRDVRTRVVLGLANRTRRGRRILGVGVRRPFALLVRMRPTPRERVPMPRLEPELREGRRSDETDSDRTRGDSDSRVLPDSRNIGSLGVDEYSRIDAANVTGSRDDRVELEDEADGFDD
jgi:hypothetical protein